MPFWKRKKKINMASHGSILAIFPCENDYVDFHRKAQRLSYLDDLIFGGNGRDKTLLMTFLDVQVSRSYGRSVFFDRDRGAEIYVRTAGGSYFILSPNHREDSCFNPFFLVDTPENRHFCHEWLVQLCKKESETTLKVELLDSLKMCVDYAFEKLLNEHRKLSNIVKVLPINFECWPQLRRWLKADGKREEGEYAYLFDNVNDVLHASDKIGFDMTHFLDNEPPQVRIAVFMYLFHWIKIKNNYDSVIYKLNLANIADGICIIYPDKKSIYIFDECKRTIRTNVSAWLPEFIKRRKSV